MTTYEKVLFLKEHGMTLRYIANRAECSSQVITNWVNGNSPISARMEKCIKMAVDDIIKEIAAVEGKE